MTRSVSFTLAAGAVALHVADAPTPIFNANRLHAQCAVDIALSNSEGEAHP